MLEHSTLELGFLTLRRMDSVRSSRCLPSEDAGVSARFGLVSGTLELEMIRRQIHLPIQTKMALHEAVRRERGKQGQFPCHDSRGDAHGQSLGVPSRLFCAWPGTTQQLKCQ